MSLALSGHISASKLGGLSELSYVGLTTVTGQNVILSGLSPAQLASIGTIVQGQVNLIIEPASQPAPLTEVPAVAAAPTNPMQQAQDIERDRVVDWILRQVNSLPLSARSGFLQAQLVGLDQVRSWLSHVGNDIRNGAHRQ